MNYEVLGPFEIELENGIVSTRSVKKMKELWKGHAQSELLMESCGCYVFCVKNQTYIPWYVGQANRMKVANEATSDTKVKIYNEVISNYAKGTPVLFILPMTTPNGKPKKPTKGESKLAAVEFLEDWLIMSAYQRNSDLWNSMKTKFLKKLYVRGIFNPKKGDATKGTAGLKNALFR